MNHATITEQEQALSSRPGLVATLRSFPRPVWVLCGGCFLNKFGTFVIPFLALYMTRQGFSVTQAGLAISAYGFGHFLASILGGQLADTIGRRKTIVLSMATVAVAMLLLSQARNYWVILLLTAITGLTGELYRPASSALLADLVPCSQRVTVYAVYRLAFNAGWAFGPATAGFLATHSFTWLFIGDAATSVLFGLVAWFALPRGVRGHEKQAKWTEAMKYAVRDQKLLAVLFATFLVAPAFFQMSSTFGLQVTARGFSAATYGALISINGALVVLFELPLTGVTQRFRPLQVMALGFVLIGLGFSLNAFAVTIPAFVVAMSIFTLGEIISMPVAIGYVSNLAPEHLRGRYMGSLGLTFSLAMMFGPAAGMALFSISPVAMWLSCGALGLIAAVIILRPTR